MMLHAQFNSCVDVYSFALVRTSKHFNTSKNNVILSNQGTDTMVSQDNFFLSLQQNAHSTAPECLLTSQDFNHSSNFDATSLLYFITPLNGTIK